MIVTANFAQWRRRHEAPGADGEDDEFFDAEGQDEDQAAANDCGPPTAKRQRVLGSFFAII